MPLFVSLVQEKLVLRHKIKLIIGDSGGSSNESLHDPVRAVDILSQKYLPLQTIFKTGNVMASSFPPFFLQFYTRGD